MGEDRAPLWAIVRPSEKLLEGPWVRAVERYSDRPCVNWTSGIFLMEPGVIRNYGISAPAG
jgi:hypothetical protein